MTEQTASDVVPTVVREYIEKYTNWGRWGEDDQLGALNFVGPDQVRSAAALVRTGEVISMSLPYDAHGCQVGGLRQNPQLMVTATGTDHLGGAQDVLGPYGPARGVGYSDDVVILPTQAGTQWDSLSHVFFEGRMYNGYSAAEVSSAGAARNGIEHGATRHVMRGVLLDVARWAKVDALEPGHAITVDELEAVAAAQNVAVSSGDAVIVRTGFLGARRGRWGDFAGGASPGLSLYTVPWLYENEVAAIVTDTWGNEVRPNELDFFQPLHVVALVHMGLAFGEIFDLDALAEHCAADGVYEFMFAAVPLPLTGASGSPLSAVAIK
jgi:kynurenine formamidase